MRISPSETISFVGSYKASTYMSLRSGSCSCCLGGPQAKFGMVAPPTQLCRANQKDLAGRNRAIRRIVLGMCIHVKMIGIVQCVRIESICCWRDLQRRAGRTLLSVRAKGQKIVLPSNRRIPGVTPDACRQYDCIVVATDHSAFDWPEIIDAAPLLIDTRNVSGGRDDAHIVRL